VNASDIVREVAAQHFTTPCPDCSDRACDFHRGWSAGAFATVVALTDVHFSPTAKEIVTLAARWYGIEERQMMNDKGRNTRVIKARGLAAGVMRTCGFTQKQTATALNLTVSQVEDGRRRRDHDSVTKAAFLTYLQTHRGE
jgi:hypothetical protein